jgi:hypothetical protein
MNRQGRDGTERFDDLIEWVRRHGRVREDVAQLVVMTRTAGVSVEELAAAQDVESQTLRQRRLRAEPACGRACRSFDDEEAINNASRPLTRPAP